jgi:hypothetical protein
MDLPCSRQVRDLPLVRPDAEMDLPCSRQVRDLPLRIGYSQPWKAYYHDVKSFTNEYKEDART